MVILQTTEIKELVRNHFPHVHILLNIDYSVQQVNFKFREYNPHLNHYHHFLLLVHQSQIDPLEV